MKVYIIHGSDVISSARKIDQIKAKFQGLETQHVKGKDLGLDQLSDTISKQGLFSQNLLFIIESPSPDLDITNFKTGENVSVIFYYLTDLPAKSQVLKVPASAGFEVVGFSKRPTVTVWPFLDLLFSKNNNCLKELDKLISEYGVQYILTMIFYGLRKMVLTTKKDFNEQKTNRQKLLFPIEKVSGFYKLVLETDFKIKSGLLEEKLGVTLLVQKFIT